MTLEDLAQTIMDASEAAVIEDIGYEPDIWYTGGSQHNDNRLTATVEREKSAVYVYRTGDVSEYATTPDLEMEATVATAHRYVTVLASIGEAEDYARDVTGA